MKADAIDVLIYTPGSSGTGYLMRFHHIAEELEKTGLRTLFVFGADKLPNGIEDHNYIRVVLPRCKFNRATMTVERSQIFPLYEDFLKTCIDRLGPKFFITSHFTGIQDELLPSLKYMETLGNIYRILAWRDVPSSPAVIEEWKSDGLEEIIARFYDSVLILGEREIWDISKYCTFTAPIDQKIKYLGYVVPPYLPSRKKVRTRKEAVVSFGGGENRTNLIDEPLPKIIAACSELGLTVCIFVGMYWSEEVVKKISRLACENVLITPFVDHTKYLEQVASSEIVFVSGGYNSVFEALAIGVPTVVVEDISPSFILAEITTRSRALLNCGAIGVIQSGMDIDRIQASILECLKSTSAIVLHNGQKKLARHIVEQKSIVDS